MNQHTDLFPTPAESDTLARLHRQVEEASEREGLLDVA
jgi:hypothetical protein